MGWWWWGDIDVGFFLLPPFVTGRWCRGLDVVQKRGLLGDGGERGTEIGCKCCVLFGLV